MKQNICKVNGISKRFGSKNILNDVTFDISEGSVFGLIGLNGAGKTTLIRTLLGLLKPNSGSCNIFGYNPFEQSVEFYRNVGVVLEHSGFFDNLNILENLEFFAKIKGISKKILSDYLDMYWSDQDIISRKDRVSLFSRGQKMQMSLCRAFIGFPKIMFLDEPIVALDVRAYDHFRYMVDIAIKHGSTILISSHQLDVVNEICDVVGMLENGNVSILKNNNKNTNNNFWMIKCRGRCDYKKIIAEESGFDISNDNDTWLFKISLDSQIVIPKIVSKLSVSGVSILEVSPIKEDLKNVMRKVITV